MIKKVKTLSDDAIASSLETVPAKALKEDFVLADRTALQKIQRNLATIDLEQRARSELEKTELRKNLGALEKTVKVEETRNLRAEV